MQQAFGPAALRAAGLRYSMGGSSLVPCSTGCSPSVGCSLAGAVIFAFLNAVPRAAWAYVFEGASWPAGTTVVLQLGLGDAGRTLIDGNTFWNTAAAPALNMWDQDIQRAQLTSVTSTASVSSGDGVNSVAFSDSIFGQSFGSGTLAVTCYRTQGSRMVELSGRRKAHRRVERDDGGRAPF